VSHTHAIIRHLVDDADTGLEYNVGDYTSLSTCEAGRADWGFEWWKAGGAAACRGGLVHWEEEDEQMCSKTKETSVDPEMPLSRATVGVKCAAPEIKLQLEELLTEVDQHYSMFLDTSLANLIAVQKSWQRSPEEVFFWRGQKRRELEHKLDAFQDFMDSTLLLLEGVTNQDCSERATCSSEDNAVNAPSRLYDLSNSTFDRSMKTAQACGLAVVMASKLDPARCSSYYMVWQMPENEGDPAGCFCLSTSTTCTRAGRNSGRALNLADSLKGEQPEFRTLRLGSIPSKQDRNHYYFKINANSPSS